MVSASAMLGTAIRNGELVLVDPKHKILMRDSEGGLGFVKFDLTPNQVNVKHCNVEYYASFRLSRGVCPRRLKPALFEANARKRKGDKVFSPTLLSNRQQTKRRIQFQRSTRQRR